MSLSIIKTPYLISFTGNPVAFTFAITPYRGPELKKDYKIIVRLEVEETFMSNTFTNVKEMLLYPEENGCATVSIQNILSAFLQQDFPRLNQTQLVPLTEQCKRYQVSYRLLNGTGLVSGSVNTTGIFFALKGGMAYQEWNPKKFFTEKLTNDKTFLRFPVSKEYVFADEYKYLTWISSLDKSHLQKLFVVFGYSDNTQSALILLQSVTLEAWQPCRTAAGYNQLNLAPLADPAKKVIWYQLSVESDRSISWRGTAASAYCLQDSTPENTGYQGWTVIEQFYLDDNTAVAPAVTKANVDTDTDYIAPVVNTTACHVTITRPTAWRAKASTAYCISDGSGNITGQQGWTTLEKYYTDDNSLVSPPTEKPNTSGDANYVAPVTNTTACPIGAHFGATTFVSGDALTDVEVANFIGIPGATVVIKLDSVVNNNGGSLRVNSSTAYLNNTWSVVLDGSGNGTLNVEIDGVTNSGTAILGHFTIISISAGTIGSPNAYQISKAF
jgi:hypothetical protein